MFFCLVSLSGSWTFCEKHPGIILVVIGVAGEILAAWKKPQTTREALEKFFGIMLIAGLVLEIWEATKEDRQVAGLELRTVNVETTNALLWQTNLTLRAEVATLEIKAQDRTITTEQREKVINYLKNAPKGPVMIGARAASRETDQYFSKVANLIRDSGFTIQSSLSYRDNVLWLNGDDSICIMVDSYEHCPPYSSWIYHAFTNAGIVVTTWTNVPIVQFGANPRPNTNEVLILVTEKP